MKESRETVITLRTSSSLTPDEAWARAIAARELIRCSRPLVNIEFSRPVDRFEAGARYEAKVSFLGITISDRYQMHFLELDEANRTFLTDEAGGAIKSWRHRLRILPTPTGCLFVDEITVKAPWHLRAMTKLYYRYRRHRISSKSSTP